MSTSVNYIILQNPTVSGKKSGFTMRKPFDAVLELATCPTGLRGWDVALLLENPRFSTLTPLAAFRRGKLPFPDPFPSLTPARAKRERRKPPWRKDCAKRNVGEPKGFPDRGRGLVLRGWDSNPQLTPYTYPSVSKRGGLYHHPSTSLRASQYLVSTAPFDCAQGKIPESNEGSHGVALR